MLPSRSDNFLNTSAVTPSFAQSVSASATSPNQQPRINYGTRDLFVFIIQRLPDRVSAVTVRKVCKQSAALIGGFQSFGKARHTISGSVMTPIAVSFPVLDDGYLAAVVIIIIGQLLYAVSEIPHPDRQSYRRSLSSLFTSMNSVQPSKNNSQSSASIASQQHHKAAPLRTRTKIATLRARTACAGCVVSPHSGDSTTPLAPKGTEVHLRARRDPEVMSTPGCCCLTFVPFQYRFTVFLLPLCGTA